MEEENKNEEIKNEEPKQKSNKVFVIVIIVVAMALTFGCGLILGQKLFEGNKCKDNKTNNNTNNNTNTIVDNTNTTIENDDKKQDNQQNNQQNDTVLPDSKAHTSFVEKGDEYDKVFSQIQSFHGISLKLKNEGKSVEISVTASTIKEDYLIDIGTEDFSKTINFNKKVKQMLFGEFGQGVGSERILFLMEDGTIEYIPYYEELTNWNSLSKDKRMNSHGTIKGISDVVLLYTMSVDGFSGYISVGAERKDGTFYDLIEFLD